MPKALPPIKLELKNIKTFRGREGYGLNADLLVNGQKVCFVRDAGDGGEFSYDIYGTTDEERKTNRATLQLVEGYAKSLPKRPLGHGMEGEFQPDLATLIDDLFEEKESAKEKKKMEKKMANTIMWGVPNGTTYKQVKFKMNFVPAHAPQLQKYIDEKVKPNLKEGEVIFNTNLQALGVIL